MIQTAELDDLLEVGQTDWRPNLKVRNSLAKTKEHHTTCSMHSSSFLSGQSSLDSICDCFW